MNIIVFAVEATRTTEYSHKPHLSELAAVKISSVKGKLKITDQFQEYIVTPVNIDHFDDLKAQMLGETSPTLKEDIQRFTDWIGDADYYLVSWTRDALELVCKSLAYQAGVPYKWIKNYNAIHSQIKLTKNDDSINIKSLTKQHKQKVDIRDSLLKAYSVGIEIIDSIDRITLAKNSTSEVFSLMSASLYKECNLCKVTKTKGEFPRYGGKCQECLDMLRQKGYEEDEQQ